MAKKFDKMLLVSDMDGTMLDDGKKVPKSNVDAVRYFIENGGYFTIASGRSEKSICRYLDVFPVNAPIICYNGSCIYDTVSKRSLYMEPLDSSAGATVIREVAERFNGVAVEIYNTDGIAIINPNDVTDAHMSREYLDYSIERLDQVKEPWYKAIFAMEHEGLVKVEEYIEKKGYARKHESLRFVYSEPFFYEVLNSSASKGHALSVLADLLGTDMERTIGVGDNYNDEEMLKMAGIGVATGNATEYIKEIASHVVCSNNIGAIGETVKYLDLIF